jgi:hypothetical protein
VKRSWRKEAGEKKKRTGGDEKNKERSRGEKALFASVFISSSFHPTKPIRG